MNAPSAPCNKPSTTVDEYNCFARSYKEADANLNNYYSQVVNVLHARPSDLARLRTAELAWIKFRDADCAAEKGLYGNGTGGPVTYMACMTAQTRTRTKDLHTIYGWLIEKFK